MYISKVHSVVVSKWTTYLPLQKESYNGLWQQHLPQYLHPSLTLELRQFQIHKPQSQTSNPDLWGLQPNLGRSEWYFDILNPVTCRCRWRCRWRWRYSCICSAKSVMCARCLIQAIQVSNDQSWNKCWRYCIAHVNASSLALGRYTKWYCRDGQNGWQIKERGRNNEIYTLINLSQTPLTTMWLIEHLLMILSYNRNLQL